MALFDEVRCKYPLPKSEVKDLLFQTTSTACPYLDLYEIREDGTLWREEDKQTPYRRWQQVPFNGEMEIHMMGEARNTWYSFRLWFRDGVVRDVIDESHAVAKGV